MPELPEVEYGRKVAEAVAHDRRIEDVWCDDDTIVFEDVTPRNFAQTLRGRRVTAVKRWGKQLWFELDEPPHPLFHFGMTGAFRTLGDAPLKLASSGKEVDTQWPPRFCKVRLSFDDGGELAMTNSRRFGRIRLRRAPLAEPPLDNLGFDPLLALPEPEAFLEQVRRRRTAIKALLLNQRFAAGVGNWIADEVLYQAGVAPSSTASTLEPERVERVREALGSVIRRAVEVDARKAQFPPDWLFHRRWGKNAEATSADGYPIEFTEVAGRTTAWVPAVQR